uniref:Peptidase M12B domain-containing protein n=1 Tax=Setaria digitata TaxID=48799 RepID=A0A915PNK6_9BILA
MQHDNSSFRYQIDILMVADFSVYTSFLEIVRNDEYSALSATNDYLYAIFEQDEWPGCSELCAEMGRRVFAMDSSAQPHHCFDQNISSDLTSLHRIDLLSSKGDSGTQGMAYVGAMCRVTESASVVEDIGGMATAVIAAHELAHSLGAFHDNNIGPAEKCGKNYLMSATVSGSDDEEKFFNTFKLSPCSIRQIQSFFENGTADCLLRSKSSERRLRRTSQRENRKPGELLVRQNQCKIAFGAHYSVCPGKGYSSKDPCRRLWCKNRELRKTEPCETKLYLPLLDGTKCGPNEWCFGGNCVAVDKERESELIPSYRPLKDCVDLNPSMCNRLPRGKLHKYCQSKQFRSLCCFACSQYMHQQKNPNLLYEPQ